MPMELFSNEYNYVKSILENPLQQKAFQEPLKKHLAAMWNILGEDGPDVGYAPKLKAMRAALFLKQASKIMESAGIDPKGTGLVGDDAVVRAGVIKFLRHLRMIHKRGNQKIWIFSCPKSFDHYSVDEIWQHRANRQRLATKLGDNNERFSRRDQRNISDATQLALRWASLAWIALANAQTSDGAKSLALIKKWFADSTTTDQQLSTVISNLKAGFKKICNTLNSTQIIFTDMPSLRNSTVGDDPDYRTSEAFVYSGRYEKLPVVYIEDAFFAKGGNVMDGMKNWARIILHEVTHLDCSTEDKLYAWAGIQPGLNISGADCAVNADSWSYFAADAAGALTKTDIHRAMVGI